MRIGILTQPLHTNYGGLLQAYALQTVLKEMGHEVWTEDRKNNVHGFLRRGRLFLTQLPFVSFVSGLLRGIYYPSKKEKERMACHTDQFIHRYLTTTVPVYTKNKDVLNPYHFEAYMVGSDQVWRPVYSPCLSNYFLDFTVGKNVKRIAYAASFGTDEWEFTPEQTEECALLAQQFDAISVREDSGVILCKQHLKVDAIHVLDPTLLLDKRDYIHLIEQEKTPTFQDKLLTYILDPSPEKQQIICQVGQTLGIQPFKVMPRAKFHQVGSKHLDDCVYPAVTTWLKGFMEAEYVVTDSFHGAVFSIIFNKPFLVIANKERGLSRFTSLLKVFDLEERCIHSYEELNDQLICKPIDFNKMNRIKRIEGDKALNFLRESLK